MDFTNEQIKRYARHIVLPEVGGTGQARLMRARVLVVGAGGLGSPLLMYLAAAGVGTIGVIDDDRVDLSNLQRQIVHDTANVGRFKVSSAAERLASINPEVQVRPIPIRLDAKSAADLLRRYDIVVDGSDNFDTRYLINDACHLLGKTLVSAAMLRFEAQMSTFRSHRGGGAPCYRCVFPERPAPGAVPSCAEAGVLGALAGMVGSMMANEVIKEILGIGRSLSGRLVMLDSLDMTFREIAVAANPNCALCGDNPSILDLSVHDRPVIPALSA